MKNWMLIFTDGETIQTERFESYELARRQMEREMIYDYGVPAEAIDGEDFCDENSFSYEGDKYSGIVRVNAASYLWLIVEL